MAINLDITIPFLYTKYKTNLQERYKITDYTSKSYLSKSSIFSLAFILSIICLNDNFYFRQMVKKVNL